MRKVIRLWLNFARNGRDAAVYFCRALLSTITSNVSEGGTKKESYRPRTLFAQERCAIQRAAFIQAVKQIEPKRLVFLDECGFSLNLHRLYGWIMGGERCLEAVPFNKGINRSVLDALSLPSSDNPNGLWTLWQKLGAWTRDTFEAFLQDGLLPLLPKGSVLVLDKARIHHGQAVTQMVEKAECSLLYLPPYSPDFNPIELAWSWIKNQVRNCAPRDDEQRESCIHLTQYLLPQTAVSAWFNKCITH